MESIKKDTGITSLEIVRQINVFRIEEGNRTELAHSDLLKIIRDEFEEEIGEGKISSTSYTDKSNRQKPMFSLTLNQSKQILMRESKIVRKAMIKYIEELENKIKTPKTFLEAMQLATQLLLDKEKVAKELLESNLKIKKLTHTNKLYTSSELAKELGYRSASSFNQHLSDLKVQYKVNNTWLLVAKYEDLGYTSIKQLELESGKIIYDRKFTGLGREFLIELLKKIEFDEKF